MFQKILRTVARELKQVSIPYMVIGGVVPRSPQENANAAWIELGREMGFAGMTVQPVGSDDREFTAEVEG